MISRRVVPIGTSTRPELLIFSRKGKNLGSGGTFGTYFGEPLTSPGYYNRDIGPGLNIVDYRGLAPDTLNCGKRRPDSRHTPFSLEGSDQGGFFTADKGSGAEANLYIEIETASQYVITQQIHIPRLLHGGFEALDRQGILGTDVDISLAGTDGPTGNGHGLENGVRVSLEGRTIHVGTGIAFIGVTGDILFALIHILGELPLHPGGKAGAAAAPEFGLFQFLQDILGAHFEKNLLQGGIPVPGNVFVYIIGVDESAVP